MRTGHDSVALVTPQSVSLFSSHAIAGLSIGCRSFRRCMLPRAMYAMTDSHAMFHEHYHEFLCCPLSLNCESFEMAPFILCWVACCFHWTGRRPDFSKAFRCLKLSLAGVNVPEVLELHTLRFAVIAMHIYSNPLA